ncbi:MAG: Ig-like domain-containing protein, partial [Candidatus Sulfotelmatobacter sp.]
TPANPSFAPGTIQSLKATAIYSDGSTWDVTGTAAWTSANSTIAAVNNQGLVNGVATGSSNITASLGSITGSATVTVTSAALVSIAVTPAIPIIPTGATQPFIATGTYNDGTTQDITTTAQWSSDTPTVAAMSNQAGSQGVATGVTAGAATISATAGTVKGITVLTVSTANLVSIAVTPAVPSIAQGTLQQFTATATYSDGSQRDLTSSATWSSSTVSTATINNTGLASGIGAGTATISAVSGSVTGSTVLTVTSATLLSIAVIPQTPSIAPGTNQQFAATGTFSDGTTQDLTQSGYWSSSAAAIATISDTYGSQGVAAAVGAGTTTIRVVSGTISGTATLTVNPTTLVSIAVNPQSASIALGAAQQFTATGTYSDGSTQDLTRIVSWHSSSAPVAVLSNTPGTVGLATSAGDGSTSILATLGQVSSSAQLTVGQPVLVSIVIAPTNVSIALGTTQQFQANGTFTDGSTQDVTASVAWASSAPSVVSIVAGGLATGIGAGSATVSATSGSITNSTQVTVTGPILVSLSVSPSAASIPVLSSQQYSATGTYSDGSTQVLTNSVIWTSSSNSVATIGSTGLASSGSAGISTITASSGSINATGSLSVGVGSVAGVTSITCPASFSSGSQCSQATVSCPSTADVQVTWGVKQGSGAGTIIIFSGAAGTTASGNNYVTPLNGAGFATVQTAWGSDWQDTGLSTKSILTAACRPAAIGKYIHDNIYSTGGFGVLGGSAGAGAIAYWLAWYRGGDLLDSAELASGPPYSDIEQGCEKPNGSSVTIIPTDGTSWVDAINFRGGPQNGVTTETGYTCQPSKGNTTQEANTAWLAQSIVQPGWTFSYPQTSVAGWVCNNALNNSEAEGYLFYSQLNSPYSLTAISGCVGTEIVDSGYTPEGVLGSTAVSNDLITQCFKKHFN